jgi:hypothetical protein
MNSIRRSVMPVKPSYSQQDFSGQPAMIQGNPPVPKMGIPGGVRAMASGLGKGAAAGMAWPIPLNQQVSPEEQPHYNAGEMLPLPGVSDLMLPVVGAVGGDMLLKALGRGVDGKKIAKALFGGQLNKLADEQLVSLLLEARKPVQATGKGLNTAAMKPVMELFNKEAIGVLSGELSKRVKKNLIPNEQLPTLMGLADNLDVAISGRFK